MHMSCDMDRPERIAATTTRRIPRNGVGDPAAKGFPMNSHTDDTNDDDNLDPTADPSPTGAPRPLGYWLKAVDRLIDREFEAAFADLDAPAGHRSGPRRVHRRGAQPVRGPARALRERTPGAASLRTCCSREQQAVPILHIRCVPVNVA